MAHITESIAFVRSRAEDFNAALVTQASAYADLPFATGASIPSGPHKCFIANVRLLAAANLKYRVEFWSKSVPTATLSPLDPASYGPVGSVSYVTTDATPYGTLYVYLTQGLKIPYEDLQGRGELHVNIQNQDGTAKAAGSAGYLHLTVGTINAS